MVISGMVFDFLSLMDYPPHQALLLHLMTSLPEGSGSPRRVAVPGVNGRTNAPRFNLQTGSRDQVITDLS